MGSPMIGFSVGATPLRISYTHRLTGASGTRETPEPFAFFGRHDSNSVELDDPSVSKKHAYLQVIDGSPFVVDLGSRSGIRLAGASVDQAWWDPELPLQIGAFDIRISGRLHRHAEGPPPTAISDGATACQFALSSGGENGGLIYCHLRCAVTLIGRNQACNFRLIDDRVRQFHAAVVQTPTDAWLVDLLSFGATRINGRSVRSSILRVGDRIGLNGVNLEVQFVRPEPPRGGPRGAIQPISQRAGHYGAADGEVQPLAEQVGDLRQATLLMANLFTEMKREQMQQIERQNELMEILIEAYRGGRLPALPPVAAPASMRESRPIPPETPIQTPRMTKPGDEDALAQAHDWFLQRLHSLGKPGT